MPPSDVEAYGVPCSASPLYHLPTPPPGAPTIAWPGNMAANETGHNPSQPLKVARDMHTVRVLLNNVKLNILLRG